MSTETVSHVTEADDSTFTELTAGTWAVVDFWADWCGPCKAYAPVFAAVAADTTAVTFAKVDVDNATETARAANVMSIPTTVLYDPAGNEAGRIVGATNERSLRDLVAAATP